MLQGPSPSHRRTRVQRRHPGLGDEELSGRDELSSDQLAPHAPDEPIDPSRDHRRRGVGAIAGGVQSQSQRLELLVGQLGQQGRVLDQGVRERAHSVGGVLGQLDERPHRELCGRRVGDRAHARTLCRGSDSPTGRKPVDRNYFQRLLVTHGSDALHPVAPCRRRLEHSCRGTTTDRRRMGDDDVRWAGRTT